ncbi:PHP domain-containing protein [Alkalihalophilus sp. As8PL]|uniref:PHP domain-containing protein n=1 Tax=Alkalihalophilus sp. As8PL TaxID=3237103 RepID=A0AB39BTZ7_9BACI
MAINKDSDLHMHSTASDGNYSPDDLMKKCYEVGLKIVALTDHDTVQGVPKAIEVGRSLGLTVIPGIELSTKIHGRSVHILGYGMDYENHEMLAFLSEQQQYRSERLNQMINKLSQSGVQLSRADVLKHVDGGSIGRPHVAKAMIDAGYVNSVSEAFDQFLAEGKPGFVEKQKEMTVKEAIDFIHRYNGVAVVAHADYYGLDEEIELWVREWGLDGIEVFHRDHNAETVQRYLTLVNQIEANTGAELLLTGGSDFHDEEYGRVPEPLGVTRLADQYAEILLQRISKSDS